MQQFPSVTNGGINIRTASNAQLDALAIKKDELRDRPDYPIPLVPDLEPAQRFPVNALGRVLSVAADAISRKVQAPVELAAQSVLAVASLAVQAQVDVQLPFGQTRPSSLFLVSVAASGDRKTSTDAEAMRPVHQRVQQLREIYDLEIQSWKINVAAWNGEKRKIEGDKALKYEQRKVELAALGAEPLAPLFPMLTPQEPTIEGLTKNWDCVQPSLGLFSAEGGQFVGGHGMSQDHRLKTAAGLSVLWDGGSMQRMRAGDGLSFISGRRLCLHLMVQPNVALAFLSDPVLRDQGLLSRILVAAPESIAGSRLYKNPDAEDERAIQTYSDAILSLLNKKWPLAFGKRNELAPLVLPLSAAASAVWRSFHDEVEKESGGHGLFHPIRDFSGKAAEHAARLSAIIELSEDHGAREISGEIMSYGVELVRWYLGEALRLSAASLTDPKVAKAHRLLEWLQGRDTKDVTVRDVCQYGPPALRNKAEATSGISILADHGWLLRVEKRWTLWRPPAATTATLLQRPSFEELRARGDAW